MLGRAEGQRMLPKTGRQGIANSNNAPSSEKNRDDGISALVLHYVLHIIFNFFQKKKC